MLTPSEGSMRKAKKMSFLNRKRGLKNKLHELTTLCDIEAVLILYEPKQAKPEIWARNPAELDKIVNRYRSLGVEQRRKGSQNLSDVLKNKKKSLEAELAKLRAKNLDEEYQTWEPALDSLSGEELSKILCSLDSNIEIVKKKLKDEQFMNECHDQKYPSSPPVVAPLNTWPHVQCSYPSGSQQDQPFPVLNSIMSNKIMMEKHAFHNSDPGCCASGPTYINHYEPYTLPDQNTRDFCSRNQSTDVDQFHTMNGSGYWANDTTIPSPQPQDNDVRASAFYRATGQLPVMTMNSSDYSATNPYNNDFWQYDQIADKQFPMMTMNGSAYSYWMRGSDSLPDRDFGPSNLSVVPDQFPVLKMDGSVYGNPNYR